MSPFRAIVYSDNDRYAHKIFTAMRTVDIAGNSIVYVSERILPDSVQNLGMDAVRTLAHNMTTSKNSVIRAIYDVDKKSNGRYTLIDRNGNRDLELNERVLSDCLRMALSDYCYANHLVIFTIL